MNDDSEIMDKISGKKFLVTGADGFVASHLIEKLVELGGDVMGLLRRDSFGTFKNINQLKDKIQIKWGDTQDLSLVSDITKGVDVIYHLAAQSHVGYSIYNPYETVINDIVSTLNILEAINKDQKLYYMSSNMVYGESLSLPIN